MIRPRQWTTTKASRWHPSYLIFLSRILSSQLPEMRSLSPATSAKLFATGCTIGPLVDSLHNQCLLKYNVLPISLAWPDTTTTTSLPLLQLLPHWNEFDYYFCSSWTVPPLLGIAYVVLGGVLPRIFEALLQATTGTDKKDSFVSTPTLTATNDLRQRAWIAVITTALIIKLSEYLELHPYVLTDGLFGATTAPADAHLAVLLVAAMAQWAFLDGTLVALLVATLTSIGGPLSELPFVGHGIWEYLPSAGDYLPLQGLADASSLSSLSSSPLMSYLLGRLDYSSLALSTITGPCYFAVTMDAIALGRWFDASAIKSQEDSK